MFATKFLSLIVAVVLLVSVKQLSSGENSHSVEYRIEHLRLTNIILKQHSYLKQIDCLARNVHYESRGESERGQLAVALVTLNRVDSKLFPNSICGVINERYLIQDQLVCQFSWRCETTSNPKLILSKTSPVYKVALKAIMEKHTLKLVTDDTYWFHANYVKPKWRRYKQLVAKIDTHIFYRDKDISH